MREWHLTVLYIYGGHSRFFYLPKTPQGDWNKLKGGKPMSKRNRMRSNRGTHALQGLESK